MDNLELIQSVKESIPETIAVIGYGSGMFKQDGYDKKDKPDKDLILVVEDFKDFLMEDFKMNPHHFTDDFDKNILERKKEKANYYKNLGCLKFYHDDVHFKVMIISDEALKYDLKTWKHFGMAGRLTKPILYDDIPEDLERLILKNRENILLTALLYKGSLYMKKEGLYNAISKLTYINDFRTILPGERKSKSRDIVSGAIDEFDEMYLDSPLIRFKNGIIVNDYPIDLINELPVNFSNYLYHKLGAEKITQEKDMERVSKIIERYFKKINLINSIELAIASAATLGLKESAKHAAEKYQKHLKR
ncbi:MAG: hypothetical protein IKG27_05895 [Bacilli bacterium]|nr:hypothetical protein [Bacilli bacterium]